MGESAIKNRVLDLLEEVLNPQTQKGLFDERRVVDVKADNNCCHIVLNNSGLSADLLATVKKEYGWEVESALPSRGYSHLVAICFLLGPFREGPFRQGPTECGA